MSGLGDTLDYELVGMAELIHKLAQSLPATGRPAGDRAARA
jgi:hypothetical protein